MADHRASYARTLWAALAIALPATAAAALATLVALPSGGRAWAPLMLVTAAAATLGAAFFALVANGARVALARDALEARGVPYVSGRRREWTGGRLTSGLRATARALLRPGRRRAGRLALHAGELVEVKPLEEILATLDARGTLDGQVFMPEMAAFCGRQLRVFRRIDKLNDYVGRTGLRGLRDTVLLEQVRCDGSGHGGCQAWCHIRWKEAWLRRAGARPAAAPAIGGGMSRAQLDRLASRDEDGERRYTCQATQLADGTTRLSLGDPRHYLRDLADGNIRPGPLTTGVSLALFNWVQRTRRGVTFPLRQTSGAPTSPSARLDLKPGDMVRVRPKADIAGTLNSKNRNRGLWFDGEMLRFCGGTYRVQASLAQTIDETTGALRRLENPVILLEGVTASGEYLGFCAGNEAIMWREIWLERQGAPGRLVPPSEASGVGAA